MRRRDVAAAFSGRRIRRSTESEGRELIEGWQASGLPVSQFCRSRGIAAHRVHYWKRRLSEGTSGIGTRARKRETPEFFAVDLASPGPDLGRSADRGGFLSIWAGHDVRIEIAESTPRETFIRALRWTVEAMRP